jgi:hypothetical protein
LEREISIKIQENQMNQIEVVMDNAADGKEVTIVKMEKSLLPKK